MRRLLLLAALAVACGAPGGDSSAPDAGVWPTTWTPETTGPADRSATCASAFGSALTASFGRVDGTVVAVVRPVDKRCRDVNNDHVVVQVRVKGEVYRLVVNVKSSFADPKVRLATPVLHALPGGPWSDGWHPNTPLDYPTDLGLHAAAFQPHEMNELSDLVARAIVVGGRISIFATSSGGAWSASAHKVHRNGNHDDGAIVLEPDGAHPRLLAFAFSDQAF